MGIVYLARDPHVRRRVAIKTFLLPPGLTSEQEREYSERFLREAQAAGALSHPSIVTIFDADTDATRGLPFIVMEYVEGGSLRDLMIRDHRLDPDRALAMASTLADALRVAHEEGIVHRDIKPANVLLRARDGQAKIVDFGVARMSTSELTSVGDVFGSPAYMSPEQFRGAAVDARSDLFSLATILYQTLCGERPFTGDDMSSLAYSVVHTPAPPIASQLPGSVREVDHFFERALAKDPADRFPDAGAFRDAVEELRRVLVLQSTVALRADEASRAFALPSASGNPLASWGDAARATMRRVRRAAARVWQDSGAARDQLAGGPSSSAREARASSEGQTGAAQAGSPNGGEGRGGRGGRIRPLEAAFALTMLVLAILPGLWALWTPGTPEASAQSVTTDLDADRDGSTDEAPPAGTAFDEGSRRSRSASASREALGRASSRNGGKGSSGATATSPASAGRKTPATGASGANVSAKTATGRPQRGSAATDAARARAAWTPRGGAAPAPNADSAGAQEGNLASLATPMSRDPLARTYEASRGSGFLVIDARSLVKAGTVKLLVDGREVYHRRLSSLEGSGAQPKKLFRRREETFSIRVEVAPGAHTVAAQVFSDGSDEGQEDLAKVTVAARESAHLRLVAGRILGASVSLKAD